MFCFLNIISQAAPAPLHQELTLAYLLQLIISIAKDFKVRRLYISHSNQLTIINHCLCYVNITGDVSREKPTSNGMKGKGERENRSRKLTPFTLSYHSGNYTFFLQGDLLVPCLCFFATFPLSRNKKQCRDGHRLKKREGHRPCITHNCSLSHSLPTISHHNIRADRVSHA